MVAGVLPSSATAQIAPKLAADYALAADAVPLWRYKATENGELNGTIRLC